MFGSQLGRRDAILTDVQDPGNLTAIAEGPRTPVVTRIPSQPAGSVTRESALGSHGFNQNYNPAGDEDEQHRPSPPIQHRRRNTLPSLVITDEMAQILAEPKDNDLIARSRQRQELDLRHYKRRSRSADALNKMISEISFRNAGVRDRESDIAYWRQSVVDNPLPANQSYQEDQRDDVTQSTFSETEPSTKITTLQTFDFGLNEREGKDATLEDRVNTLEVKMIDFEYAIEKLQGRDVKSAPPPKLPLKRRSIHDLFPETDSGMSSSSLEPTSFLSSPDHSPVPESENEKAYVPDRTSKATTIRPLTAHRRSGGSPPSPVRITVDQFDKLMDILRREQNSRRQLEAQVNDLQKELEALRQPIYAEIRQVGYPITPNQPGTHDTPNTQRTLRRSPPFPNKENQQPEQSRFSMSDVESDYYDEVYETPQDTKFTFEQAHQPRSSPLIGVN
jgi:hypothetical protein